MLLRILGALILLAVLAIGLFVWLSQPVSQQAAESAWFGENDRYVTVEGEQWRIRQTGPQTGETLVLIHGFSHSLEGMDALAAQLNDTYRVIQIDLPAHGLTGARSDGIYDPVSISAHVSALLKEITDEPLILLGHSLGGLVSWNLAVDNPDQVSHLILLAPGGYSINGVGDDPVPVPTAMRFFLSQAPRAGVELGTTALYHDPSKLTDAQIDRIQAMMKIDGNGEAMIALLEQFTLPDPNPRLRQISAPTLIIWGSSDAMVPAMHGPRFDAAIPNARLVLINEAGHMINEERPDGVADAIRGFLSSSD